MLPWTLSALAETAPQGGADAGPTPAAGSAQSGEKKAPPKGGADADAGKGKVPPATGDTSDLKELEQALQRPASASAPGALSGPGPIVESASRHIEKAVVAPSSVLVIDKDEIRLRGYSQLTDVLRDLPGVDLAPNYFSEIGTNVSVRGISGNNKIVFLVNGMRVNPPGGEDMPLRSDFCVRFAERIEIVYGSGTTLYGQDGISMVINVVTRKPAMGNEDSAGQNGDEALTSMSVGGTDSMVEVGAEGGNNFEREAWGWFSGVLKECNDVKITAYVQYHDSDMTPLDQAYPAFWQAYKNQATAISGPNGPGVVPIREDYGLNVFGRVETENMSIQVWHRESQRSSAEGALIQADPSGNLVPILGYLPQAVWGDSSNVVEGRSVLHLTGNMSLESLTTYSEYEIDPDSRYVEPVGLSAWNFDDYKWGRGWKMGQEEVLRMEVSEKFTLLFGGIVSYSDIIPKASFPGGFDPGQDPVGQGGFFNYSTVPGGPLTAIPEVSEVKYWTYSAYTEGQWQMLDRLKVVGGVRITKDDHYTQVPITPRASLIYTPADNFTIKYMYTNAFVAPAPYFAYSTYDNGVLLATTNPGVAPETAQTHELNFAYNKERFSLGLSFYYGTQSNLIVLSDQDTLANQLGTVYVNGLAAQPRELVQTANGGVSKRYGADFYGKYKGEVLSPWWSYSYVDFEETVDNLTTGLPGTSKHNGRLGVTWKALPRLFLTPSLAIQSTPANVNPGAVGSQLDTPYTLNLYMLYKCNEHLDIFADFKNLTDHHYALGGFTGFAMPQETFQAAVGARLVY